jgi:hypothetical protein
MASDNKLQQSRPGSQSPPESKATQPPQQKTQDFTFISESATNWSSVSSPRVKLLIPGKKDILLPGDKIINHKNITTFHNALKNLIDSNIKNVIVDVKKIEMMTTFILSYYKGRWVISHYKSKDIGDNIAAVVLKLNKLQNANKHHILKINLKNEDFVNGLIEANQHIFGNEKKYDDHIFVIRANHPAINYTQFNKNNKTFNSAIYILAGIYDGNTFISKAHPKFKDYESLLKLIKPIKLFEPEQKITLSDIKDVGKFYEATTKDIYNYGYAITFHNDYGIFGNNNFIFKTEVARYVHDAFMAKAIKMHINLITAQIDNVIFASIYNSIVNPKSFKHFIDNFCPYYAHIYNYVNEFMQNVSRYIYTYNVKNKQNCIPPIPQQQKIIKFCTYVKQKYPFTNEQQINYEINYKLKLFGLDEKDTFIALYEILSPTIANMLPRGI